MGRLGGGWGWTPQSAFDTIRSAAFGGPSLVFRGHNQFVMTTATPRSTVRTDQELLERAAHGDERGLAELYDRYAPPLYSLALRVTGLQADAEEVVLDAFSQAWREAGRFRADRGSVAAWLTMICRTMR